MLEHHVMPSPAALLLFLLPLIVATADPRAHWAPPIGCTTENVLEKDIVRRLRALTPGPIEPRNDAEP